MNESIIHHEEIDFTPLQETLIKLREESSKVIIGQHEMIDLLLVGILANGHVLLEGVPGIAKTLATKVIARMLSVNFSRIQFTPDLMPSDITGTSVFNAKTGSFAFNRGPVFSNIVLIDEINRAPAKTQSALFEVMEERQITVDGTTYILEDPFLVFATQNPLEHEGTYRLPEAQLDRFLFKILVNYPTLEEETEILKKAHERKDKLETSDLKPVLSAEKLLQFQRQIRMVHIEAPLMKYIAEIIHYTRSHPALHLGASPRASIHALIACKAFAAINGRSFVIPEDIHAILHPVLNHRIYLTPEKELEGQSERLILSEIIASVEIPR